MRKISLQQVPQSEDVIAIFFQQFGANVLRNRWWSKAIWTRHAVDQVLNFLRVPPEAARYMFFREVYLDLASI
jgi:hypothetical protein